jgi:release factor glutamine methyltransferase
MRIKDLLKNAYIDLEESNISNPALEAGLLLANVLNKDRIYLYLNSDEEVNSNIESEFLNNVKLRKNNMPIQYIIGNQEFMGLNFKVDENVLIPRADTEILVEEAIKFGNNKEKINILDIGTGSGCIAVSLAYFLKNSEITAIDISNKALEIASKNANINKVNNRVKFLKSDIFSNVPESYYKKFDLIVSNPPYIDNEDFKNLNKDVKDYEPKSALYGGKDGMFFYDKILENISNYLKKDGLVIFEIGYNQKLKIKELIKKYNLKYNNTIKDLSKNDRVVLISLL